MNTYKRKISSDIYKKLANYYDALYQYKDYRKECKFLKEIFRKHLKKSPESLLDLGCGTGGHALVLAETEPTVVGVDLSKGMIEVAKKKAKKKSLKVDFKIGDVRNVRLGKKFNAVLLMFNVIGYQTTNNDLLATFKTASSHLQKGGIFVFDCWFGPAVLRQMPEKRKRVFKGEKGEEFIKTAVPEFNILEQTISVKYEISRLINKKITDKFKEVHVIRFLFPQEIEHLLNEAGLSVLKICPVNQLNKKPTFNDWNITVITKKQ